jgi:hypothetical protein
MLERRHRRDRIDQGLFDRPRRKPAADACEIGSRAAVPLSADPVASEAARSCDDRAPGRELLESPAARALDGRRRFDRDGGRPACEQNAGRNREGFGAGTRRVGRRCRSAARQDGAQHAHGQSGQSQRTRHDWRLAGDQSPCLLARAGGVTTTGAALRRALPGVDLERCWTVVIDHRPSRSFPWRSAGSATARHA